MKDYIRLLRPKHYLKNVLVLLPLFFSGRFFEGQLLIKAAAGFAAFCLLSSFIYIINDVRDVESDRQHPAKCKRPIASGAVGVPPGARPRRSAFGPDIRNRCIYAFSVKRMGVHSGISYR